MPDTHGFGVGAFTGDQLRADGGISVGVNAGQAAVRGINTGTVTFDAASVAGAISAEQAVTITGVAVGDIVVFVPDAAMSNDAIGVPYARVSAADTVRVKFTNPTAGAIDLTSQVWRYLWFDLT